MSCGHLSEDIPECPLCLEPFALDDINFYPCACRYQICRFCWHRIRTDENGLCPHCREPYSENPAEYTPPSQEQLVKLKHDKKQRTHDKKQKLIESRKNLSSLRVVQKNLVFVIGLSPRLAEPEILKKNEYFGKYGKIYKVVINNSTVYNGAQGPSVSAYVTYYREEDASKAIQAVNNAFIDGRHLKASYGTTKYCTYFLRGSQCTKPDCMYLHEMGNEEASFTKEDMQAGKHQMFESQTLAASNAGMVVPGREGQGGQSSSKKQDPLLKGLKEIDSESALPATASWATRQAGGGLLPIPQMKESKPHSRESAKHSKSQKSQKHSSHSHTKSGSEFARTSEKSLAKSSSRGTGSGPLSPHSILGPGPTSESSTTRRHNSTGSRNEHSSTRSTSITRSNSTAASCSSKSVSPNLSPKSSLSASSSSGSLKQDLEGRGTSGGGKEGKNSEREVSRDVDTSGKPHPLESVSRQLDPIDIDDTDDWGLQEVRAATDAIADTCNTANTTTDTTNTLTDTGNTLESKRETADQRQEKEAEKLDAVDVISSLGSTATGQFGSLGVSWNSGAPPISSNSPPPPPPSYFSAPGDKGPAHRHLERNKTPDDDLGFDPWDVSARGLADLLETEQQPTQSGGGGGGGTVGGATGTIPAPTVALDATNLSWQDELKTVFPNVNISFGGSSSSTPAPRPAPLTATSSTPSTSTNSSAQSQTPLQQAINGAAQSMAFPYHQAGVGGMGALFGYSSPMIQDYRSLYEAAQSSSSHTNARLAFEAPKFPSNSTIGTTTTPQTSVTTNSDTGSTVTSMNGGKGFTGSNSIDWPDLSSSVSAVGTKRTGKTNSVASSSAGLNSNVATWNGSSVGNGGMGNGSVGNGSTKESGAASMTNNTARSKELPSGTAVAPPPGFTTRSSKDASLSSSVNHVLWSNTVGKAGVTAQPANPAMTNQILQNWAKYLQMNFGGLTPQQLASNPLYQQMVRQQQQYWALLRQQQLIQLQQAGVSVPNRAVLTPAQIQQLQSRMALGQSALNQATAHARLQQQQQQLQQTLQQQTQAQQQQARNNLVHVGVPATAIPVSGQSTASLGQAVRLGQSQGAAASVLMKSNSQSNSSSRPSQPSQKVPSK